MYNMDEYLHIDDFPACCAAEVLRDFPEDDQLEAGEKEYKEDSQFEKEKFQEDKKKGWVSGTFEPPDEIDYVTRKTVANTIAGVSCKIPLMVATTLAKTQSIAGKLLRKAGFRDVRHFLGITGNELILWVKVNKPVPKKTKKPSKKGK